MVKSKRVQKTLIAAFVIFSIPFFTIYPQESMQAETLIEAIKHAYLPYKNMKIEWEKKNIDPLIMYPIGAIEQFYPLMVIKNSLIISGERSRLFSEQSNYNMRDLTLEPDFVRQTTCVFNGKVFRELAQVIKGNKKIDGSEYPDDKNSYTIASELFLWHLNLYDQKTIDRLKFSIEESSEPNIYILSATDDEGMKEKYIVDKDKEFNVIKIEEFFSGRKSSETNYIYKTYPNGMLYLDQAEKIEYHPDMEPRIAFQVKVSNVEFYVDVPDETFVLEFPPGIKVWDGVLEKTYTTVPAEPSLTEDQKKQE